MGEKAEVKHCAKFTDSILDALEELLVEYEVKGVVLDPFAGVGRVHELQNRVWGIRTVGVEIEEEWAKQSEWTIHGDSRFLADIVTERYAHAIVTSPAYGNRMADSYAGDAKGSRRHTYRIALGRPLTDGNGASMQWGRGYRSLHSQVWRQCALVLKPGGLAFINVKNHIRGGVEQNVVGWHIAELIRQGFGVEEVRWVDTPGMREGQNHELRVDGERIIVARLKRG
jgi:tRNA G10  N-methylase Trm11